jgi:hypothetical protein
LHQRITTGTVASRGGEEDDRGPFESRKGGNSREIFDTIINGGAGKGSHGVMVLHPDLEVDAH